MVLILKLIYLKNQELHIKCLLKETTISFIKCVLKLSQKWSVSIRFNKKINYCLNKYKQKENKKNLINLKKNMKEYGQQNSIFINKDNSYKKKKI